MEYNSEVRRRIKRECKARVSEYLGRCIGIKFLYMLPSILISVILYISVFGRMVYTLMSGNTNEMVLAELLSEGMNSNAVWIVTLVMVLVTGPLTYGIMQFYIALRHGEGPGVSTLFKPFTSAGSLFTGIKMGICLNFRSMLWMSIPTLAATSAWIMLAILFSDAGEVVLSLVSLCVYALYLVVSIPVKVKLKEYEAGWAVINGNEEVGAWNATGIGGGVFYRRFGNLFGFMFSFAGWYLLQFIAAGACSFLAAYAVAFIGGTVGVTAAVLAVVAMFCILLMISAFLTAYVNTSFLGLFEYLSKLPNDFTNMGYGASNGGRF